MSAIPTMVMTDLDERYDRLANWNIKNLMRDAVRMNLERLQYEFDVHSRRTLSEAVNIDAI